MTPLGQPEITTFTVVDRDGTPSQDDVVSVRLRYGMEDDEPTVVVWTEADPHGIENPDTGVFRFEIPGPMDDGRWLVEWTAYDIDGKILSVGETSFDVAGSAWSHDTILRPADYDAIRGQIGLPASVLTDALIDGVDMRPAAEALIRQRIPSWLAILTLPVTDDPIVSAVAMPDQRMLAATYYVRLIARSGFLSAPASTEKSQVVALGEVVHVVAPMQPGIDRYDVYVGLASGNLYLQAGVKPGEAVDIKDFTYSAIAITDGSGDVGALKAATIAAVCANLCASFQRSRPSSVQTLTYKETSAVVDWRVEQRQYVARVSHFLGLINGYRTATPSAMTRAPGSSREQEFNRLELSSFRNG